MEQLLKNKILNELNDYICDIKYLQTICKENNDIEGFNWYLKKEKQTEYVINSIIYNEIYGLRVEVYNHNGVFENGIDLGDLLDDNVYKVPNDYEDMFNYVEDNKEWLFKYIKDKYVSFILKRELKSVGEIKLCLMKFENSKLSVVKEWKIS